MILLIMFTKLQTNFRGLRYNKNLGSEVEQKNWKALYIELFCGLILRGLILRDSVDLTWIGLAFWTISWFS